MSYLRPHQYQLVKRIGLFLLFPLLSMLVLYLLTIRTVNGYQARHEGRIYTGISVQGIELGQLTHAEVTAKLRNLIPSIEDKTITVVDQTNGQKWSKTFAELGVSVQLGDLVNQAYAVGRIGDDQRQFREQLLVWYNGLELNHAFDIVVDEFPIDRWLAEVAEEVDIAPIASELIINGREINYTQPQAGQQLDTTIVHQQILAAVHTLGSTEIPLTIDDITLDMSDYSEAANALYTITSAPLLFYIDEPIDHIDLNPIELPTSILSTWAKLDSSQNDNNAVNIVVDEEKARDWVGNFSATINRYPKRARFYFDDFTSELVLIEPHVNGRRLNVDATVEKLIAAAYSSGKRTIPFVFDDIVPIVHSNVKGEEIGITEEITTARQTTSFAGSPPERRHNIARVSQNYYGLIIGPGEEFSFNRYLDALTEENGYVEGLIIAGGQTQREVGGGICQVSTTIFQSAFWGGFELGERMQHSYRVGYYENDPSNPYEANIGMDATIYNPLVDFTFRNNTPHHLLIENYYDGPSETMTVKFYSTNIGRTVDMKREVWDETDQLPDKCIYNPDLEPDEVQQVEWGIGGANVLVERYVYNYLGKQREYKPIRSSYVAMRNVYEHGSNVNPDTICLPELPEGSS